MRIVSLLAIDVITPEDLEFVNTPLEIAMTPR